MVREAARRGLTLLAAAVALSGGAARGEELCTRVTIPAELGLSCTVEAEGIAIAPTGGTFAALSHMTIRPIVKTGADATAWSDPAGWLRTQMTPDLAALPDSLAPLATDPDSPFGGGEATAAIESLRQVLGGFSALLLTACDTPAPSQPDEWRMRCDFTNDGLGLYMTSRVVTRGDERWAMSMRAANEQRLRNFEAIANSFQPP